MNWEEIEILVKVESSLDTDTGISGYRFWDINHAIPTPSEVSVVQILLENNWEEMFFNTVWGKGIDPDKQGTWLKQKRSKGFVTDVGEQLKRVRYYRKQDQKEPDAYAKTVSDSGKQVPSIKDFIRVADEQVTGEGTTPSALIYRQNNEGPYENLTVEASFGMGRATNIPWIAFLGYNQVVQRGIYPVLLYYKDYKTLVLAYGISVTTEPIKPWPDSESLQTISAYFEQYRIGTPRNYGNSYVYKVYKTNQPINESAIQADLVNLVAYYHACFSTTRSVHEGISNYEIDTDKEKPFISKTLFYEIAELLKRKKNIILKGPPGVGKTFLARKIAYQIMGKTSDEFIEMIQFHQSYSYEDFIQGLRPTNDGFKVIPGVFFRFCQKAVAHPEEQFFFIIDEINRGNLSKIFGELLMLIEADKREKKYAMKLTYSEIDEDVFFIPANLYIIGTMNTADRSLAIVDYALRRRFAFVSLEPEYGENFKSFLLSTGLSQGLVNHICSSVVTVNNAIKADDNLGGGFQIGHSFFCDFKTTRSEDEWWNEILRFEVAPLLEEIWFDDPTKVREMLQFLSR